MNGNPILWPPEDEDELRKAYAIGDYLLFTRAVRILAKRKGITRDQLTRRARALGVARISRGTLPWTPVEIDNLRHYAGKLPAWRIAKILGRTKDAIHVRLSHMKLSGVIKESGYTRKELARVLGIDTRTLQTMLRKYPIEANLFGFFFQPAVDDWLWRNLERVDLRKADQTWLKMTLRGGKK